MEKEEKEKKQFQEADDAYDELMKKNIGTLYKLFWEVKEKNTNFTYIDPKGMRKMLTEKKLENKEYGRELIDYIVIKLLVSILKHLLKRRQVVLVSL